MTVQDVDNAFRKKAESNVKLYVIRKKIENGTATMEDMSEYSNILCKLLGKTLGENISGIPESERAKFCEWLLRNQYEDTNERLATVQRFLDKKQNIHIAAKKPKFPAERVRKAAHSLEDKTVSEEVIQRRAENAVANIANSFHDDYIKENAEFRQNAGLKCHVTRIGAFECCAWCAEVAGRYEVGKEPADFWRRHDNCSCRMDYENQKVHQRLSGTGKGWKVDSEVQRRQAQRIEYKPKRFSKDEAKSLENEKLSRIKGLTIAGKTDIMGISRKMSASLQNPPDFSKYSIKDDAEAVKSIHKTISETLGIPESSINLNGIRNTDVLEPFVKRLQRIQSDTGMKFPKIIAMEVIAGDNCCIANYQPIENTFYISSRYFNSKDALTDTLKDWSSKNILPKQAKSIAYLAEHESAHIRIPDALLESDEANKIWKKRKLLNDNDADIYEYYADATAIYRMNPNVSDNNIIKAIEYLRNGGVIV